MLTLKELEARNIEYFGTKYVAIGMAKMFAKYGAIPSFIFIFFAMLFADVAKYDAIYMIKCIYIIYFASVAIAFLLGLAGSTVRIFRLGLERKD